MVVCQRQRVSGLHRDHSCQHPPSQKLALPGVQVLRTGKLVSEVSNKAMWPDEIVRAVALPRVVLITNGLRSIGPTGCKRIIGEIPSKRVRNLKLQAFAEALVHSHQQRVVPISSGRLDLLHERRVPAFKRHAKCDVGKRIRGLATDWVRGACDLGLIHGALANLVCSSRTGISNLQRQVSRQECLQAKAVFLRHWPPEAGIENRCLQNRLVRSVSGKRRQARNIQGKGNLLICSGVLSELQLANLSKGGVHEQLQKWLAGVERMVNPIASAQHQALRLWQPPRKPKARIPCVLVLPVDAELVIQLFHIRRNRPAWVIRRNQISGETASRSWVAVR